MKYLDWAQDVDHFATLMPMLDQERRFLQFNVLVTLDGMLDQLDEDQRRRLTEKLRAYPAGNGDATLVSWRDRILHRLA